MENTSLQQSIFRHAAGRIAWIMGIVFFLASCTKEWDGEEYRVYDDKMIDEMMEEQGLLSFLSVVDKAAYTGTIHAYGFYTLFAPTNEAVSEYLQVIGKNSVNDLTKEEAVDIVKYHLVRDTIPVAGFTDGRLASPNFANKYLTTKIESEGGKIYRRINRQARIIAPDVPDDPNLTDWRANNGYLHVVDKVLTPPENSITDVVRSLSDDYSLLKELYETSGLADSLSVESNVWYTFFIQDNEAFGDNGIDSKESLLAKIHELQPSTVKTDEELIRDYIGYHTVVDSIMPKFGTDLMKASSLFTLTTEKKPILFERVGDKIYLNRLVQGQLNEPGVELDRTSEYADWSCSNGVVHKILGDIQIKDRSAYRVYWDIAEQPEIMALKNFRKAGCNVNFNAGELSEFTWGGKSPMAINYYCGSVPTTEGAMDPKSQYVYADFLRIPNLCDAYNSWVELKLPVLMPGDYKVWLCWRREANLNLKFIFKQEGQDDQIMPYIFSLGDYMPNPANSSHEQMVLDGWKQYTAKAYNSVACSHLIGTIKVESEGRHTLRLEPTWWERQGQSTSFDMIQFIPKDDDQVWPMVAMNGDWIENGTPNWTIWPYGTEPEPDPEVTTSSWKPNF
jgi:uncharacterized surface protein with fasciclin (FAS1) repeats